MNHLVASAVRNALPAVGAWALCAALALPAFKAQAAPSVEFSATDIADLVVGEDLWRYVYTLTGPLAEAESVNLLFAPTLFGNLTVASNSAPALVDHTVTQPFPALSADGQLMLTALVALGSAPSIQVGLDVVWLGGAGSAPGAQSFQWLDDQFNELALLQTTPVPEPAAALLWLAGAGLLGPAMAARRRRAGRS